MNLFEVVEFKRDAWSIEEFEDADLIIHGDDYLRKIMFDTKIFTGHGPEYLSFQDTCRDEFFAWKALMITPTILFDNAFHSEISNDEDLALQQEICDFHHLAQSWRFCHVAEYVSDPILYRMSRLKLVLLEEFRPTVKICPMMMHDKAKFNKILVSYAANKKCAFMADSIECGLIQAQMRDPVPFLRTCLFQSSSVFSHFQAEQFLEFCSDRTCLPILAFLSCNRDILDRLTHAIAQEEPDVCDSESSTLKIVGQWLGNLGYLKSLTRILQLYQGDEQRRMKQSIFSGVEKFTLLSLDAKSEDLLCRSLSSEGYTEVDFDTFELDWLLSFDDSVTRLALSVALNRRQFVSKCLIGIQRKLDSMTNEHAVKKLLVFQQQVLKDIEEQKMQGFSQYTSEILKVELKKLPSKPRLNFIGVFLNLWLRCNEFNPELLPMCTAVAAAGWATADFLRSQFRKRVVTDLLDHFESFSDTCIKRYANATSTPGQIVSFAKTMSQMELFFIEYRRLMCLIDIACALGQFHYGLLGEKWPSSLYFRPTKFIFSFPSSRLLYALTLMLQPVPADQHVKLLQQDGTRFFVGDGFQLDKAKNDLPIIYNIMNNQASIEEDLNKPD